MKGDSTLIIKPSRRRNPDDRITKAKVKIARDVVLAMEPEVLVFDEPTGALDQATAEEVTDLYQELSDRGQGSGRRPATPGQVRHHPYPGRRQDRQHRARYHPRCRW